MNTEQLSPRDEAIKRTLIAMAELPPRRTPWWRSVLAIVGGFAIGGAVTGFLTAGAFAGWIPALSTDDQQAGTMQTFAMYQAQASTAVGQPHYVSGSGNLTIELGEKPQGATRIAYAYWCLSSGHLSVLVDGTTRADTQCTGKAAQPHPQAGTVQGGGAHTLVARGSGNYAVWATWITQPPTAGPSDAQKAAVADGVVTRDEYIQSYARLQGCMAQAGYPLGNAPTYEIIFNYSLRSDALYAFDFDCYPREFQDVDGLWQGQVEQRVDACLKAAGITPDRDRDIALQQLAPAGLTPQGCGLLS